MVVVALQSCRRCQHVEGTERLRCALKHSGEHSLGSIGYGVGVHVQIVRLLRHLLGDHLAGVELNEHAAVRFQFLHWNRKAEVVKKKELEFEVVQLMDRETPNLELSDSLLTILWIDCTFA